MPRFAANLTFLWQELTDPYARYEAAASAGFRAAEQMFPWQLDAERVAAALRDCGLELVLFNAYAGDWEAGDRGVAALPGREREFRRGVEEALALAERLGTRRLNCLLGCPGEQMPRAEAERTAVGNLAWAARLAEGAGVTLHVENVNSVDVPGYLADTPERAAALVEAVGSPALRLQLDQYHVGMMGGDPLAALQAHGDLVGHVQVADVPGRHEPGTGEAPVEAFLDALDGRGYDGYVGLEYVPRSGTDEGLEWLDRARRGA